MQTNYSEQRSPDDWYLIACNGDIALRLAQDLVLGEDPAGTLVLNPPPDDALLRISRFGDRLEFQVLALDMTLSTAGQSGVQYLEIAGEQAFRIDLPGNDLRLCRQLADEEVENDEDDRHLILQRTGQPAITAERITVAGEPAGDLAGESGSDPEAPIGPLPESGAGDDQGSDR